ncbi:hypothetical protein C8J56DRAFT_1052600 [Mycena floridula]|nr:hypothetical protein C8J56DRAFT_1052600 [Mycena floridula]
MDHPYYLHDHFSTSPLPWLTKTCRTYWMVDLAHDADARPYFKFLFIFVLYTLAMTLFDSFPQWGITILLSALTVLYQMTLAAFSVHLDVIPPVLAVVTVALSVEIWQNHALEKAMSNTADISETVYIHETRIIENMCVDD